MAKVKGRGSTCFVGFDETETVELVRMARRLGLRPTKIRDYFMNYLVKGPMVTDEEMEQLSCNPIVLTKDDFLALTKDEEFVASIPGHLDFSRICFTGFKKDDRAELEAIAKEAGMVCTQAVWRYVGILVTGPRAGPAKLEQAKQNGTIILTKEEFLIMVSDVVNFED